MIQKETDSPRIGAFLPSFLSLPRDRVCLRALCVPSPGPKERTSNPESVRPFVRLFYLSLRSLRSAEK